MEHSRKLWVPSAPSRNEALFKEYFRDTSHLSRRVETNFFNRAILASQGLVRRDIRLIVDSLRPVGGDSCAALSISGYGIYLAPRQEDRFTELHEETHGLIEQLNPKLFSSLSFREIIGLVKQSKDTAHSLLTKLLVDSCTHEGIANYVAVDISLNGDDEDLFKEGTHEHDLLLFSDQKTEESDFDAFDAMDFIVEIHSDFLDNPRSKNAIFAMFKSAPLIGQLGYIPGYNFIYGAMNALLIERGLSKIEALEAIIKNPPTTFYEIRNPYEFVDNLPQAG